MRIIAFGIRREATMAGCLRTIRCFHGRTRRQTWLMTLRVNAPAGNGKMRAVLDHCLKPQFERQDGFLAWADGMTARAKRLTWHLEEGARAEIFAGTARRFYRTG